MTNVPAHLVRSLAAEVEVAKTAITAAYDRALKLQDDMRDYHEPVRELSVHVRATREEFETKVSEALEMIEQESAQLRAIIAENERSIEVLGRVAGELRDRPLRAGDDTVSTAIRVLVSLFPLAAFAFYSLLS
jgi:predicted ribosome quality control (RQC) complex YloA/Tae2 family protein